MPKVERLTDKLVRSLRTEESQEEWWDESRPGFYVRVTRGGTRTFCYSYRQPGPGPARERRRRSMVLGGSLRRSRRRSGTPSPTPSRRGRWLVGQWRRASTRSASRCPAGDEGEPGLPVVATLTGVPPAHHSSSVP
jgi:hypothetical protein